MKKQKIEPWEKKIINRYIIRFTIAGIAGMFALGLVIFLFKYIGWGEGTTGILFLPWLLSGLFIIPTVFHQGVIEGENRGLKS